MSIITLTKQPAKSSPSRQGSAAEITPAMVAAGVHAYRALDREFDADERIVRDVFEAMTAAALEPNSEASLDRLSGHQSHWWHP